MEKLKKQRQFSTRRVERELPKIWAHDPDTLQVRDEIDLGKGVGHQVVVLEKLRAARDCQCRSRR